MLSCTLGITVDFIHDLSESGCTPNLCAVSLMGYPFFMIWLTASCLNSSMYSLFAMELLYPLGVLFGHYRPD